MKQELTFKVKTYLGEELIISGSAMGFVELRNMIADASRYHAQNGRTVTSDNILKIWEQLLEDEE